MLRDRLLHLVLAVALPLAVGGSRAAADWLVLAEGGRLETRGPWEVRGKLVVFTTTDGQLSSMRIADVDLDASREATEAAARQTAEPPTPTPASEPRRATFVLTDADVAHGAPASGAAEAPTEESTDAASERLVVTQWQEGELPDGDGLRLSGTLQNRGGKAATRVQLTALVYDREGSLVATRQAELSTNVLMPDRQARFRVDFPGVFSFSAVKFDPTSLDFESGSPEGVEAESGADDSSAGPEPPSG